MTLRLQSQPFGPRHYDSDWSRFVRNTMSIKRGHPTSSGSKSGRAAGGFACAIAAALGLLFSANALASPPLSVQRYSLEEGLSQQAVNAIVQDSEGFMWFGTEDGLNRFDGYEFRQLRHDRSDPKTLPNGFVMSLVAAEDGVWIGTDGGGVVFRNALDGRARITRAVARLHRSRTRAHACARSSRPPVGGVARLRRRHLRPAHRGDTSAAALTHRTEAHFPTTLFSRS